MNIIADTHLHTIASTHAYSTILEIAKQASEIGLKYIAITDHAPSMADAPHPWHFHNLQIIPDEIYGVRILKGIEANILDKDGTIDLDEPTSDIIEWVVASFHKQACAPMSFEDCTSAYIGLAQNPYVNVIGHSGLENYKYDYAKVIPIFKENNKLIEFNQSSYIVRPQSAKNCLEIAKICKEVGAKVIVNSDAHFALNIGKFDGVLGMLKSIDFPEELIVNTTVDRFEDYLYKHCKNMSK